MSEPEIQVICNGEPRTLPGARTLAEDGGVEVVSPSELLRRVSDNVWAVGCTCDTPGAGAGAGHNGYSCADGTKAFCASDEECFAALEFAKGDWRSGCGKPSTGSVEAVGAGVLVEAA